MGKGGVITGRIRTFLDPTFASKHIPIIASVSEHQPTAWGSYIFDLHITVYLMSIGLYFGFKNLTDGIIFLITYGTFAVYISENMVRIMLVLAPATSMLSAIGISEVLTFCRQSIVEKDEDLEIEKDSYHMDQSNVIKISENDSVEGVVGKNRNFRYEVESASY